MPQPSASQGEGATRAPQTAHTLHPKRSQHVGRKRCHCVPTEQTHENLISKRECANFKAWKHRGSVAARLGASHF